ncbi:MAG: hypothetical protein AAF990_13470 [Bacteroidota bacterium]
MIRLLYVLPIGVVLTFLMGAVLDRPMHKEGESATVSSGTIIAYVYRGGTQNPGYYCSTESTGDPVSGLKISLRNWDTKQLLDEDITDINGRFELMAPTVGTHITLEPCKKDYLPGGGDPAYNGLTVDDLYILRNHIRKDRALHCPMLRVAGDFQFDGQLDSADLVYLNSFVVGPSSQKYPDNPWRLLPNILNFPTRLHPDPTFTTNFWTFPYPNLGDPGALYPFEATLNLFGAQLGYMAPTHWRDTVDRWEYTPAISACGVADYGFWLVKAGDLNGSATIDIANNCIGGTGGGGGSGPGRFDPAQSENDVDQSFDSQERAPLPTFSMGRLSLLDEGEYWLQVTINSQQPIEAYQMGLQLDTSWLNILEIDPIEDLEQSLALHYNDEAAELSQGHVKTVWLDNETTGSIAPLSWRRVIQLRVLLKRSVQTQEDLLNTVSLDTDLMKAEFISNYTILDAGQVEIKFEFEAI